MCFVTHLDCQVCKVKDKYLFHPCESFIEDHVSPQDDKPLPPRKHFHCPELAWPLPEHEDTSHHICDRCLRNGIIYYQRTVAIEQDRQFNERHYNFLYPAVKEPSSTPVTLDEEVEGSSDYNDESDEEDQNIAAVEEEANVTSLEKMAVPNEPCETRFFPHASEIEGQFPPNWNGISRLFKNCIRDTHCRDKNHHLHSQFPDANKPEKFENHWHSRLAEEPHRVLTLWIPFCTICRRPSFNHKGGIDGVEFEPSAFFWKWLKKLRGEKMIVTDIVTGFIHKPCETCIEKETELRYKVYEFYRTASSPGRWSVWHWLMTRGTNWTRFWDHDTLNVGLPDVPCYDVEYFLQLMAAGWKARSGVAWEDTVDLDPPVSCPVATYLHQEPLLKLSQWNDLAGVSHRLDPVVRPPTLAAQARALPYNEVSALMEKRDEPRQESPANANALPTVTIPNCSETPVGEVRTLRQWNAKLEDRAVLSEDVWPAGECKRFFTVNGAVIDENGHAVKALERARDLASQQQEGHTEQTTTPGQTPTYQPPKVNGGDVDTTGQSRKRQASGTLTGHDTKRARVEEGEAETYPTPSTGRSRGRSPHTPSSVSISNSGNRSSSQGGESHEDHVQDDNSHDLFGDNEVEASPSGKRAAAAALVELKSNRAAEADDPASGNPVEEVFSKCGHSFWHLHSVGPKDRWSFGFGVHDEEDDDGWD